MIRVYNNGTVDIADESSKNQTVHESRIRPLLEEMLWRDTPVVPFDFENKVLNKLRP
jgi:hypothetical protein